MTFKTAQHTDILNKDVPLSRMLLEVTDWRLNFWHIKQILRKYVPANIDEPCSEVLSEDDFTTCWLPSVPHKIFVTSDVKTYTSWVTLYETFIPEFDRSTSYKEVFVSIMGGVANGLTKYVKPQETITIDPKFNPDIVCVSWKVSEKTIVVGLSERLETERTTTVERSLLIYIPESAPLGDVFTNFYEKLHADPELDF